MKSKFLKTFSFGALILVCFAFTNDQKLFKLSQYLDLYSELYKELNRTYVDEVEPATLMKNGLDAMLKSMDPYTNYITEATIESARIKRSGGMGNIGARLGDVGGNIVVAEILENMAAAKAGVKAGDQILKIDGEPVKGRSLEEIELFLTGQPDTEVELEIQPFGGGGTKTLSLQRSEVAPKDVTHYEMLNDTVGYVQLTSFTQRCGSYVATAIKELQEKENMKYLVFDLRYNPGGLLNEAIGISNLFIDKGELVVFTKGREPEWDKEYKAQGDPLFRDLPMVVLTNHRSASASEIVSGVMQDLDRAVVLGQRTFGKGLVQQTRKIGYNAQLKLTVAKYYLPSGRCIQAIDYYGAITDKGAAEIPDSLKQAFTTKNGRKVYDAGGVKPDIVYDRNKESDIMKKLKEENLIFGFLNQYQSKHTEIAEIENFEFTDADFEEFKSYVNNNDFEFNSETEEILDVLDGRVKSEKYSADVQAGLKTIRDKVVAMQTAALNSNKEEIQTHLYEELIGRYYYQKGKTKATLGKDPEVNAAIDLFGDMGKYESILIGG